MDLPILIKSHDFQFKPSDFKERSLYKVLDKKNKIVAYACYLRFRKEKAELLKLLHKRYFKPEYGFQYDGILIYDITHKTVRTDYIGEQMKFLIELWHNNSNEHERTIVNVCDKCPFQANAMKNFFQLLLNDKHPLVEFYQ
jgi:hypothetical protein